MLAKVAGRTTYKTQGMVQCWQRLLEELLTKHRGWCSAGKGCWKNYLQNTGDGAVLAKVAGRTTYKTQGMVQCWQRLLEELLTKHRGWCTVLAKVVGRTTYKTQGMVQCWQRLLEELLTKHRGDVVLTKVAGRTTYKTQKMVKCWQRLLEELLTKYREW